MYFWSALPALTFVALWLSARSQPRSQTYNATDWSLNLLGLGVQGLAIPWAGYLLTTQVLPRLLPGIQDIWPIGFWGALAVNLIVIDALYYVQHRLFHHRRLWRLHETHHNSPRLDVWATARNSLWINGLFVYLWLNPLLGHLTGAPEGVFAGAMITASLDLWRHSGHLSDMPWAKGWLTRPIDHHRHHDADKRDANFGANFIVWDRLFGTADLSAPLPARYASTPPRPLWRQFLWPWGL